MSKRKHIRRRILFIFTIFMFILFATKTYEQYLEYTQLSEKVNKLKVSIEEEKNKQIKFIKQKEYYKSDEYIEEAAREKYGLIKKNEELFIIKEKY